MLAHAHRELHNAEYVVFVNTSRRYIDFTEGVCKLLGYSRDELLGKRIEDISYDVHAVPLLFAQFLETGAQTGEYVLQRSDHTPLPIRYRAFLFSDGCHAAIWDPVGGWKELYLAALLEMDPGKQKGKIESAIRMIQETRTSSVQEQRSVADALTMLGTLQKIAKAATGS
jgi:PAS domain-containing protein